MYSLRRKNLIEAWILNDSLLYVFPRQFIIDYNSTCHVIAAKAVLFEKHVVCWMLFRKKFLFVSNILWPKIG